MIELQYGDAHYILLRNADDLAKLHHDRYLTKEQYPMIVCVVDNILYNIKHVSNCLSELRATSDDIDDFLRECTKVIGSL